MQTSVDGHGQGAVTGHAITQVRVLGYGIVKKERLEDFLGKDFPAERHPVSVKDANGDNVRLFNRVRERVVPEISVVRYEVLLPVQNKQAPKKAILPEQLAARRSQGFRYADFLAGVLH